MEQVTYFGSNTVDGFDTRIDYTIWVELKNTFQKSSIQIEEICIEDLHHAFYPRTLLLTKLGKLIRFTQSPTMIQIDRLPTETLPYHAFACKKLYTSEFKRKTTSTKKGSDAVISFHQITNLRSSAIYYQIELSGNNAKVTHLINNFLQHKHKHRNQQAINSNSKRTNPITIPC